MTTPDKWDLDRAVFDQSDGIVAMVEALRRTGAVHVEFGYRWPEGSEPPPGVPVTWYATATLQSGRGRSRTRWTDTAEVVAVPGQVSHEEAQVEALAELVRRRGGNVTVVRR